MSLRLLCGHFSVTFCFREIPLKVNPLHQPTNQAIEMSCQSLSGSSVIPSDLSSAIAPLSYCKGYLALFLSLHPLYICACVCLCSALCAFLGLLVAPREVECVGATGPRAVTLVGLCWSCSACRGPVGVRFRIQRACCSSLVIFPTFFIRYGRKTYFPWQMTLDSSTVHTCSHPAKIAREL